MSAISVIQSHNSYATPFQAVVDPPKPRGSVYDLITDRIIKQLESGVAPWRKPWSAKLPVNLISQKPYRGLNVLTLASQGYPSRFWLTFNQASKLGGRIRKGEHSSPVIYWNLGEEREYTTREGETRVSKPFLLRYSNVFNLSQTDGIGLPASALQETRTNNPIEDCERIVAEMPNRPALEQSDKAWYAPARDVVGMPSIGLFRYSEDYYSTFFHELTHATGHKSRVGREGFESVQSFGSESYSKEELVAEMGAAMLCGITGIENRTLENSAAYLKTWIERLKSDSRLIVTAASAAQKASDYVLGHQQTVDDGTPSEVHA
jgi:antirestriction protein ArdC